MRAIIARIAAAVIAVLLTFLAGTLGVEVSPETTATLTEGVTLIGLGLWGIVYAVFHKLLNRRINPSDSAA